MFGLLRTHFFISHILDLAHKSKLSHLLLALQAQSATKTIGSTVFLTLPGSRIGKRSKVNLCNKVIIDKIDKFMYYCF